MSFTQDTNAHSKEFVCMNKHIHRHIASAHGGGGVTVWLSVCLYLVCQRGSRVSVSLCVCVHERKSYGKLYPVPECDSMAQVHLCLFSGYPEIWQESEKSKLPTRLTELNRAAPEKQNTHTDISVYIFMYL